jgi:hypothetical protein
MVFVVVQKCILYNWKIAKAGKMETAKKQAVKSSGYKKSEYSATSSGLDMPTYGDDAIKLRCRWHLSTSSFYLDGRSTIRIPKGSQLYSKKNNEHPATPLGSNLQIHHLAINL